MSSSEKQDELDPILREVTDEYAECHMMRNEAKELYTIRHWEREEEEAIATAKAEILKRFRSVEDIEAAIPTKEVPAGAEDEFSGSPFDAYGQGYNQALNDVRQALNLEGREG